MHVSKSLLVIGAGSWGTALAIQSARLGHVTRLWGPDVGQWQRPTCNDLYLPEIELPEPLQVVADWSTALQGADDILLAVPSHAFASVLKQLQPHLHARSRLVWGTKGFDPHTGALLECTARSILGPDIPLAVLSGPSFAKEVARGQPTSMTLASRDADFVKAIQTYLHGPQFSIFSTTDTVGVAVGGAVKNVIAIAVGLSDGMGHGANARCALITRGLHEISKLAVALGGDPITLMGLSGMGDLVLTCTDDQSRNRRYGLALASGLSHEAAAQHIGQVVEGAKAVHSAEKLAHQHQLTMPIVSTMAQLMRGELPAQAALQQLLSQPSQPEYGAP